MLGNGFDLEHELPTKYTQFLDFLNVINTESDKKIMTVILKLTNIFIKF